MFERARFTYVMSSDTPLKTNTRHFTIDDVLLSDSSLYHTIMGQFGVPYYHLPNHNSCSSCGQLVVTLHFLRYLYDTQFQGHLFPSISYLKLCVCSDVNWVNDLNDRKPITTFYTFLVDSLISLKSKKHDVVSRSSIEAQYHDMVVTTCLLMFATFIYEC